MVRSITEKLDSTRHHLLVAGVAATLLAYWPPASNLFSLPKATVVVLLGCWLVLISIAAAVSRGVVRTPNRTALGIAGLLSVGLMVATYRGGWAASAVLGPYGRYSGLLLYLALVVVFLVASRQDVERTQRLFVVLPAVGSFAAIVAIAQWFGADPTGVVDRMDYEVVSFLGNPNFVAGSLAITGSLALGAFLQPDVRGPRRTLLAVAVVLQTGAVVASGSEQGPIALFAGFALAVGAWMWRRDGRVRRFGPSGIVAVVIVGGAVVVTGLLGSGPLSHLSRQYSFEMRGYFWAGAGQMFLDDPVLGVGLGQYGVAYRTYRDAAAAARVDLADTADAAHSVPLEMFAEGGALLGIAYLALVAFTGWHLLQGLRRTDGPEHAVLSALGGAWLAYQIQSIVSIDVPPLAALHFLLAGTIVSVTCEQPGWSFNVPRAGRTVTRAVAGGTALIGLVLVVPIGAPLRADSAARTAVELARAGETESALRTMRRAQELAPWETTYLRYEASIWHQAGYSDQALARYEDARRQDPRDFAATISAARFAAGLGEPERSWRWYESALELEPHSPHLKAEAAQVLLALGRTDEALRLAEAAVEVRPEEADWWYLLGRVHRIAGDEDQARDAFRRALSLEPGHEDAAEALDQGA